MKTNKSLTTTGSIFGGTALAETRVVPPKVLSGTCRRFSGGFRGSALGPPKSDPRAPSKCLALAGSKEEPRMKTNKSLTTTGSNFLGELRSFQREQFPQRFIRQLSPLKICAIRGSSLDPSKQRPARPEQFSRAGWF
jgi:hypothetical protein